MTYEPYVPPPQGKLKWTQPVCTDCWTRDNNKIPSRLKKGGRPWDELLEVCCFCGRTTSAQIFIRIDPTTVPYPAREAP